MTRVCVFVDGSSFYFGLKERGLPTRVDYHELSKALVGPDRELVRTFYYNSAYDPVLSPEQWKGQQSFLESLYKTPYLKLELGKLVPQSEGSFKEKGTDVLLAGDLLFYAARNLFDTAMVITDNADFAPILSKVKELGKTVEVGMFPGNQPKDLVHSTDLVVSLMSVLEKFKAKIFPQETVKDDEDLEDGPQPGNRIQDLAPQKIKKMLKPKIGEGAKGVKSQVGLKKPRAKKSPEFI